MPPRAWAWLLLGCVHAASTVGTANATVSVAMGATPRLHTENMDTPGQLYWKVKTGGAIKGSPTIYNRVLYVAPLFYDGVLYGFFNGTRGK